MPMPPLQLSSAQQEQLSVATSLSQSFGGINKSKNGIDPTILLYVGGGVVALFLLYKLKRGF
jgi:hypothetical protein